MSRAVSWSASLSSQTGPADPQVVYNGTKFTPVKPAEGEHKDVKVKSAVTPEEEAAGKEALAQEALRVVSSMPAGHLERKTASR